MWFFLDAMSAPDTAEFAKKVEKARLQHPLDS